MLRRLGNGYREYEPLAVELVRQIRELTALGLSVEETRPFVESLAEGREADVGYRRELVHRLRLPYPLLPDPRMTLAAALGVPTFGAGDMVLYRRLTLIVRDGVIEHVFHPIPAPAMHALEVMQWRARNRP